MLCAVLLVEQINSYDLAKCHDTLIKSVKTTLASLTNVVNHVRSEQNRYAMIPKRNLSCWENSSFYDFYRESSSNSNLLCKKLVDFNSE